MISKPKPRLVFSELLLRLFRKSRRPDDEAPAPPFQPPRQPPARNVEPPHVRLRENLTPEQRAERIMQANRVYWRAEGRIEAFYDAYPLERPPGHVSEVERDARRGRGRGGR